MKTIFDIELVIDYASSFAVESDRMGSKPVGEKTKMGKHKEVLEGLVAHMPNQGCTPGIDNREIKLTYRRSISSDGDLQEFEALVGYLGSLKPEHQPERISLSSLRYSNLFYLTLRRCGKRLERGKLVEIPGHRSSSMLY